MRRLALVTAALVAAVAVFTLLSLPPAPVVLETSWSDDSVPGVFHVHTNRSDGRSTPEAIAAAAARAGLKFLVFTDHGDATRVPDPPSYRSGVLCLDGVEISTSNGHYLAFDMGASPYPLGGEGRDVVEDVRRLGGFGIAAHPTSPKADLQWTEWAGPIDGIELVNPDTSWRVHLFASGWAGRRTLLRALLTYPIRASETIAALLTGSPALDARWTDLAASRRVVGLAGVDAHARLELRAGDHGADTFSLPLPGYAASFEAMSVHVVPAEPLTGEAAADARRLVAGVRRGRVYTAVDAWGRPPRFRFWATHANGTAEAGDEIETGGAVTWHVRSNAPPYFRTTVRRDNDTIAESLDRDAAVNTDGRPGMYRVEVRSPERPAGPAWVFSNPIFVRARASRASSAAPAVSRGADGLPLFDGRTSAGWTTESDPTSLAAVEAVQMVSGVELRLRFGLPGGAPADQYAGAVVEAPRQLPAYDRVVVTMRAERPMRVSVQARAEFSDAPAERWQRSLYVDTSDRQQVVRFDDMRPIGATRTPHPPLVDVRALLFVVDTTNTRPGTSGRVWMRDVQLSRATSSP